MDTQRKDVTSCYNSDFDAKKYLQTRFSHPQWHQGQILKWFGEFFQKYLTVEKSHIGATHMITMVEISGGPCIANMLVAAPYVSTIVFSDYLPQNLKEVELWQKNDPSAYDWSPYMRFILKDVEGGSDSIEKRSEALRKKITTIQRCDLKSEHPLGKDHDEAFNLVVLTNALESVCNTVYELKMAINKLSSLLKPGGYLALSLPAEGDTWTEPSAGGGSTWPMLMITAEVLDQCITRAGMCVKERRRWECTDDFTLCNAKFYYCVFAQKQVA